MTERKPFSTVFEKNATMGTPEVQIRRFTDEDRKTHEDLCRHMDPVGIFWGTQLLGVVDFDDLYDEDGNRFYND